MPLAVLVDGEEIRPPVRALVVQHDDGAADESRICVGTHGTEIDHTTAVDSTMSVFKSNENQVLGVNQDQISVRVRAGKKSTAGKNSTPIS